MVKIVLARTSCRCFFTTSILTRTVLVKGQWDQCTNAEYTRKVSFRKITNGIALIDKTTTVFQPATMPYVTLTKAKGVMLLI